MTDRKHDANAQHLIQLHAQACNALHMALHHLRDPQASESAMFAAAMARAYRGLAALKQASALVNQEGGAA